MPDDFAILDVLETVLRERGEARVPAVGLSMGSRFADCDGLVVVRPGPRGPRCGDVAVYRGEDGRWIAHRVLWRRHDRSLTKGDGLRCPDWPPVSNADMVGVVAALIRDGRRRRLDTAAARAAGRARAALGLLETAAAMLLRGFRRRSRPQGTHRAPSGRA
jgi:hypothetical protein